VDSMRSRVKSTRKHMLLKLRRVGVGWWWFKRQTKVMKPKNTVEGHVDGDGFPKCIDLILKKSKLKISRRE
jgi:hypothetical protein